MIGLKKLFCALPNRKLTSQNVLLLNVCCMLCFWARILGTGSFPRLIKLCGHFSLAGIRTSRKSSLTSDVNGALSIEPISPAFVALGSSTHEFVMKRREGAKGTLGIVANWVRRDEETNFKLSRWLKKLWAQNERQDTQKLFVEINVMLSMALVRKQLCLCSKATRAAFHTCRNFNHKWPSFRVFKCSQKSLTSLYISMSGNIEMSMSIIKKLCILFFSSVLKIYNILFLHGLVDIFIH